MPDEPLKPASPEASQASDGEGADDDEREVPDLGTALAGMMDPQTLNELKQIQAWNMKFYKEEWPRMQRVVARVAQQVNELHIAAGLQPAPKGNAGGRA